MNFVGFSFCFALNSTNFTSLLSARLACLTSAGAFLLKIWYGRCLPTLSEAV